MLILFFLNFLFLFNLFGAEEHAQYTPYDPYCRVDYETVFDEKKLKQFTDVLDHDGTIKNMPADFDEEQQTRVTFLTPEVYQKRKKSIAESFLKDLKKEKNRSAITPMLISTVDVSVKIGCTIGFLTLIPSDSIGFSALIATLGTICWANLPKDVIRYFNPSSDPYEKWEIEFANKMQYIPCQLWPRVIDVFTDARAGKLRSANVRQFFEVVFNLPSIHYFPYNPPFEKGNSNAVYEEISQFTSAFFSDYQESENAKCSMQLATRQYLEKLSQNGNGVVSIHLEGPNGCGKHHYVKLLAEKFTEVFGHTFPVREINIRSELHAELDGNQDTPGALLKAITQISKGGTPYGMLIFDSADWLNGTLRRMAQKMFDPKVGYFSSKYLNELEIRLSGFLIFFLSNSPLEDPSSSKIVNIKFPLALKRDVLAQLAMGNLNQYLKGTELSEHDVAQSVEITEAIER